MKGIAWFGFDSDTYIVHGLASWAGGHDLSYYFDFLVNNGFNAIRLPFSQYLIDNNPTISSSQYDGGNNNALFSGKTALEAMDVIIAQIPKSSNPDLLDFRMIS